MIYSPTIYSFMNTFLRIAGLGLLLLVSSCSSTPTFCECRFGMVEKMTDAFRETVDEGKKADTTDLEEMARKCKEAYGNLTADQQLQMLKDCD